MSETPEPKSSVAFHATVGSTKPCRALVVRVVNGNLHLRQAPADIIIVDHSQLTDFFETLNAAMGALSKGTEVEA